MADNHTYTIPGLFAETVLKIPDGIAIDHPEGCLTYRQLDVAASAFAEVIIREHGIRPGALVLLMTGHGTRNIVAILGILKAGACYVPIDKEKSSVKAVQNVLTTVDAALFVNTTLDVFTDTDLPVFHMTDIPSQSLSASICLPICTSDDTACIIFTSGSTGKPKGVMIPHDAIAYYSQCEPFNMNVGPGDRVLHILNVAFDAATPSILETFPPPTLPNPRYPKVHTVLLGGETPSPDLLKSWLEAGIRVLNGYGPTEAASGGTIHTMKSGSNPTNGIIGTPMPESPVYLIDEGLSFVQGEAIEGEIAISGRSLAKGYYKDEARTKMSFINCHGKRLYRTGDYGRWTRDTTGTHRVLEFRGRKDRTVKNRGFLINLGTDIEGPILALEGFGIKQAHATKYRSRLIVVCSPKTVDVTGLQQAMRTQFCSFCIPDRIVVVDSLPLSANGKVISAQVYDMVATMIEGSEEGMLDVSLERTKRFTDKNMRIVGECMAAVVDQEILDEDANFFGMGGQSLAALKFISLCRTANLEITIRDVYQFQTIREIAARAREAKPSTATYPLANSMCHEHARPAEELHRLVPAVVGQQEHAFDEVAPLTRLQLELILPTVESDGENTNQMNVTYNGPNSSIMVSAWKRIHTLEPVFRTEFNLDVDQGIQVVRSKPNGATSPLQCKTFIDWSAYESVMRNVPMQVGLGSRLDIFHYSPAGAHLSAQEEVTVVLTIHHALMDGFSAGLLRRKVSEIACSGQDGVLRPSTSFLTACHNLITMQNERDAEARAYWDTYLHGAVAHEFPLSSSTVTTKEPLAFSTPLPAWRLQRFAACHNVSIATLYYTAWGMTLAHLHHSKDIVVGAVFSGRETQPAYADVIGPLISTIPLRIRIHEDTASVAELLQQVMTGLGECSQYTWSRPDQIRVRSRNLLAMQCDLPIEGGMAPVRIQERERSSFELSLLVKGPTEFQLASRVHSQAELQRIQDLFIESLGSLVSYETVAACQSALSTYSSAPEYSTSDYNTSQLDMNSFSSVTEAFHSAVFRHANRLAVEDSANGTSLTYAELDRQATMVAHQISQHAPGAKVVTIYADGSSAWIISILGILKAGAAFCPLDPAWPKSRIQATCILSGAHAMLVPRRFQLECLSGISLPMIVIEDILTQGESPSPQALSLATAGETFFIVFTSGTTGQPKGVPVSHRGFLALQSNPVARFFVEPGHRIAQFMSPAFDCCANEIFSALLHGAALVLKDPEHPYAHLKRVDIANLTPSVLGVLDETEYQNISILYSSGEAVTPGLVNRFGANRLFYNGYGPAEVKTNPTLCSVFASFTRLLPGKPVTIGNGTKTVRLYILSEDLEPTPPGDNGEIFVAGIQVMSGYIGAVEENTKRLLADPWHPGEFMFRTGDYGRHCTKTATTLPNGLEEGEVEYIGRVDRQVKLRGSRIELPAVEQMIYDCDPNISLAAVAILNECLVAFLTPGTVNTEAVRDSLVSLVAPAWVPQLIVAVDELPMSVNKKIDYRQLQGLLTSTREAVSSRQRLQGAIEEQVATEWRHVLKLDPGAEVFADDHFFRRGGHSVLQMLLAARLSKAFNITLSIREMVQVPILRDQAILIQDRQMALSAENHQKCPSEQKLASDCPDSVVTELERQIWSQYQLATSTSTFNIPIALEINGPVDDTRLRVAINATFAAHPVFRSNFVGTTTGTLRRTLRPHAPTVQEIEHLDLAMEINRPFDLARDELMRAYLCRAATGDASNEQSHRYVLCLVTTHVLTDRHGIQAILRDIARVYNGQPIPAPPTTLAHLQSPVWKRQPSSAETQFWAENLADIPNRLNLHRRSSRSFFEGSSHCSRHAGLHITQLNHRARDLGITKHQIVLAAAAQAFEFLTGSQDVVLGAPFDNRPSLLEMESAAQFLDRLPIRIRTAAADDGDQLLLGAHEASQQAVAHAIPFSQILSIVGGADRQLLQGQHPIFECVVTFHVLDSLKDCLALPGCTVTEHPLAAKGAKFLLILEWTEVAPDEWLLRIEFDHSRLAYATVETLDCALREILCCLADGQSRGQIQARLEHLFAPPTNAVSDGLSMPASILALGLL
ncbi:hypothetical protein BBP40_000617 [Aspergillus hancockii]|nr:hypothetical protein BBP40_000617 [Aspergillus hancockii]